MPTRKGKTLTQHSAEPKPAPRRGATGAARANFRSKVSSQTCGVQARAKMITDLLDDLDGHDLELLETVRLMESRTRCGKDDPVAKFITSLIHRYGWAEDRGEGSPSRISNPSLRICARTWRGDQRSALYFQPLLAFGGVQCE